MTAPESSVKAVVAEMLEAASAGDGRRHMPRRLRDWATRLESLSGGGEVEQLDITRYPSAGPASTLPSEVLVTVFKECSGRLAMYNTEVLFHRVQECDAELRKRLIPAPSVTVDDVAIRTVILGMDQYANKPVLQGSQLAEIVSGWSAALEAALASTGEGGNG